MYDTNTGLKKKLNTVYVNVNILFYFDLYVTINTCGFLIPCYFHVKTIHMTFFVLCEGT